MHNNNQENDTKEPKEFYEKGGSKDPNFCNHAFTRLSPTRILCNKCGLGFFDNPFDPFPVEEMNKQIQKEVREQNKFKREQK
jgi:hypothetical protein